jgi:hypothetical protein
MLVDNLGEECVPTDHVVRCGLFIAEMTSVFHEQARGLAELILLIEYRTARS